MARSDLPTPQRETIMPDERSPIDSAPNNGAAGVAICQGCCCARTVYGSQNPAALARAERLSDVVRDHGGTATVTECLGPCSHADVVVVRPSRDGRRLGARPVWLEYLYNDALFEKVAEWVSNGGPGVADIPDALADLTFTSTTQHTK